MKAQKWFLSSKTVLFNAITAILGILPFAADFLTQLAGLPELQTHAKVLLVAAAIINIILRSRTDQPVTITKPDPKPQQPGEHKVQPEYV